MAGGADGTLGFFHVSHVYESQQLRATHRDTGAKNKQHTSQGVELVTGQTDRQTDKH